MNNKKLVNPVVNFLLAEIGERKSIQLLLSHSEKMPNGVEIDHIKSIQLALSEINLDRQKEAHRVDTSSAYCNCLLGVLDDE